MANVPKQVSDYMRALQRRSARSRWAGMTPEDRTAAMQAVRKHGKRRKPKRHNATGERRAIARTLHPIVGNSGLEEV
jgi:predicted Fe-S protein YdhL (DUF1289 family)